MNNPFNKPIEQITEEDLQSLIDNKIRESQHLEYKRDNYPSEDKNKKEFLKDVSALANGMGGHLLIGVGEDNNSHLPVELVGIENAEDEKQAAIQVCNDSIQERIQGLRVETVSLKNGKSVLIIEVPPSIRKPHMVSFKKGRYFWKRRESHVHPMTLGEIRYDVIQGNEMLERTERRFDELLLDAREKSHSTLLAQVIITPVYSRENLVNLALPGAKDVMAQLKDCPGTRNQDISSLGSVRPFIEGIERKESSGSVGFSRLRLFTDGAIEHVSDTIQYKNQASSDLSIHSRFLSDLVVNATYSAMKLYKEFQITGPFAATINILANQSPKLITFGRMGFASDSEPFESNEINLPPISFQDFSKPTQIARDLMDGVFRAFGIDRCPYFEESGEYIKW